MVDVAGGADHAERLEAQALVGRDRELELFQVDAVVRAGRDRAQRVASEAQDFERPRDAAVRLSRGVADQTPGRCGQAVGPNVAAGMMMTRDREPDQGRDRGAADQKAAGALGKLEQLPAPVDHLALDVDRTMIAAAEIGVHGRGQKLGQQAARGARAVHPAEEAGVDVAGRVGEDRAHRLRGGGFGALARDRERCTEGFLDRLRHRLPDRPLADRAQIVERLVEQPMAELCERVPVGGIERAWRGSWHGTYQPEVVRVVHPPDAR